MFVCEIWHKGVVLYNVWQETSDTEAIEGAWPASSPNLEVRETATRKMDNGDKLSSHVLCDIPKAHDGNLKRLLRADNKHIGVASIGDYS